MKPVIFVVAHLARITLCVALFPLTINAEDIARPRVFITTDIGINDPDDDQSVCHLLQYANEVEILGLVPDLVALGGREDARKRLRDVLDAYQSDYENPAFHFQRLGYPSPKQIEQRILWSRKQAIESLIQFALEDSDRPLYVLVWGRMQIVSAAAEQEPSILKRIRLLSIATNLRAKYQMKERGDGAERNWNWSPGRDRILELEPKTWWIESDWTYNGMFPGPYADPEKHGDPIALRDTVKGFGAMGHHIWHMGNFRKWSGYFRCGDTPTLTYLLDRSDDDDPTVRGWAGEFTRPFEQFPNFYTGVDGGQDWDYESPKRTWQNADAVLKSRVLTLLSKRKEMYDAYLGKLARLYGTGQIVHDD